MRVCAGVWGGGGGGGRSADFPQKPTFWDGISVVCDVTELQFSRAFGARTDAY